MIIYQRIGRQEKNQYFDIEDLRAQRSKASKDQKESKSYFT
jgi:hypothetical protein